MALSHSTQSASRAGFVAILVAVVALIVASIAFFQARTKIQIANPTAKSSLIRTKETKTIRAGYSNFKPYTIFNPNTQNADEQVTGFSADLLKEIASRQSPPWKIEWHKITFETLRADMESGRFDVFADAVYQTIPRASDFGLTVPYSYFGVAVGLVRKNETRFNSFEDLDREGVTIALAQGWTSTEYAQQHLKKPTFKLISVGDDPFVQLQEVIAGRVDIALQDVPTVLQFAQNHPNEVKALWIENPPSRVPAGFMVRQGDWEMLNFLNSSMLVLQADGTIRRLDEKWSALNEFPNLSLAPGSGLRSTSRSNNMNKLGSSK